MLASLLVNYLFISEDILDLRLIIKLRIPFGMSLLAPSEQSGELEEEGVANLKVGIANHQDGKENKECGKENRLLGK